MAYKENRQARNNVKNALERSILESAEVLKNKAISNAPTDTGKLKKSIKVVESDDGLTVTIGSDDKIADYAEMVEFGTIHQAANPFFRTAIKESRDKMLKKFRKKI